MSGTPALAVVGGFEQPGAWRAALESAVRAEFLGSPLLAPAGSPLVAACGVEGCCRPAGGLRGAALTSGCAGRAGCGGRRPGRPPKDEWLSADAVPVAQRASDASLKARNQTLLDENRRLREEVAGLREELAGAWGVLRALQRRGQRTGPARTAS